MGSSRLLKEFFWKHIFVHGLKPFLMVDNCLVTNWLFSRLEQISWISGRRGGRGKEGGSSSLENIHGLRFVSWFVVGSRYWLAALNKFFGWHKGGSILTNGNWHPVLWKGQRIASTGLDNGEFLTMSASEWELGTVRLTVGTSWKSKRADEKTLSSFGERCVWTVEMRARVPDAGQLT